MGKLVPKEKALLTLIIKKMVNGYSKNGEKILAGFYLKVKKYKHGLIGIQDVSRKNKLNMIMVLKFLNYVGTKLEIN